MGRKNTSTIHVSLFIPELNFVIVFLPHKNSKFDGSFSYFFSKIMVLYLIAFVCMLIAISWIFFIQLAFFYIHGE
jgi:hypothetical protein